MISADFQVTYRDGTVDKVRITQYGHSQWQMWKDRKGLKGDDLGSAMARVMAWAEQQRDAKAKTAYEAWDATVDLVEPLGDMEPVDPTRPATSAG